MRKLLPLVALFLMLFGCSATGNEQFNSLTDQGILPLSTNNAYLGSNLFLANEFTRSSHLFNFLHERGAPAAMELEGTRFSAPHLLLYYPREKQVYMADLASNDKQYQWIVRGPFQIERKDFRELARTLRSDIGEPQFMYHGKLFRFRPTAEELARLNPTPTPTPSPVPTKKPIKKPKVITKVDDVAGTPAPKADEPFKPLNSDQQAIAMAQGFAERAPNGDVIHTVKGDGETFEKIAEWYTGSANNALDIATVNSQTLQSKLSPGNRIQIPLKMIKQFKVLR